MAKENKKWIIAFILFLGFFLLYQQLIKNPFPLMSLYGITGTQPTGCFEFNQKIYCPGDPGFVAIFSCNRPGIECPEGMVCSQNGLCEVEQPEMNITPLLIVGLILLAWVLRKS